MNDLGEKLFIKMHFVRREGYQTVETKRFFSLAIENVLSPLFHISFVFTSNSIFMVWC